MKKLILSASLLIGLAAFSQAADITFQKPMVNTVMTATANIDIDLSTNNIDMASFQFNYSSASPTTISFTDGTTSTGSITVLEGLNGLTTAYATNKVTVSSNAALAGQAGFATIVVSSNGTTGILSGSTITINGVDIYPGTHWTISASSVGTAASIAQAINAHPSLSLAYTGSFTGNQVIVTCKNQGAYCNAYSLTTSTIALTLNGGTGITGTFHNGNDNAVLYVNGSPLTQGIHWTAAAVASNTAISINNALNRGYSALFVSSITLGTSVVTSTSVLTGTTGNSYVILSSTPNALASSTTFTGGRDAAIIKINNYSLVAGVNYAVVQYSSGTIVSSATATNIAAALSSTSFGGAFLTAQAVKNLVTATSTVSGLVTNYTLTSSSDNALSVGGTTKTVTGLSGASVGQMWGGTNSDVIWASTTPPATANFPYIYPTGSIFPINSIGKVTSQWGTGLPVLVTASAGTLPWPLLNQTTYYATSIAATSFKLAQTSTDAVAGNAITIASATIKGGGSFLATPIPISGTFAFKIQKSNDDVNFQDIYLSSTSAGIANIGNASAAVATTNSFASPFTASSVMYELGNVYFRWLRVVYTNGVWGGINLNALVNGKAYSKSNR